MDYTGGLVFRGDHPRSHLGRRAVAARSARIVFWNPQVARARLAERLEFELDDSDRRSRPFAASPTAEPSLRWTAYVLGIFYLLRAQVSRGWSPPALTCTSHSEVPLNKGVSSSAAVEVAVMNPRRAYGLDLARH